VVTPAVSASFGSPADGATVSGTVEVTMNAGNTQGSPTQFLLRQDASTTLSSQSVSGSTATYMWNTASVPPGGHTLDLTVTDPAGRTGTASIHVSVSGGGGGFPDTTPPTAVITAPGNGAWTGNSIHVTAQATDDVGPATLK